MKRKEGVKKEGGRKVKKRNVKKGYDQRRDKKVGESEREIEEAA